MSDTTLDHAVLQELVAALADAELPLSEARVVQRHLGMCARCRRELALQRDISSALARQAATRTASASLRGRIEQIGLASAERKTFLWTRWAPRAAAGLAAVALAGMAALMSTGVGKGGASTTGAEGRRAAAAIPLLRDAAADCRRAMQRNFPRGVDLSAVRDGLPFPVRVVERADAQLFSTWRTTLAGSPAAGLAYRWRGIVVVQYAVAVHLVRDEPELAQAVRSGEPYAASLEGQGIVASVSDGTGTVLLADASPEVLSQLVR